MHSFVPTNWICHCTQPDITWSKSKRISLRFIDTPRRSCATFGTAQKLSEYTAIRSLQFQSSTYIFSLLNALMHISLIEIKIYSWIPLLITWITIFASKHLRICFSKMSKRHLSQRFLRLSDSIETDAILFWDAAFYWNECLEFETTHTDWCWTNNAYASFVPLGDRRLKTKLWFCNESASFPKKSLIQFTTKQFEWEGHKKNHQKVVLCWWSFLTLIVRLCCCTQPNDSKSRKHRRKSPLYIV